MDKSDTVEVCLMKNKGKTFVKVRVRSKVKTGLISQDQMEYTDVKTMEYRVQAMGGALAEYQAEQFGDSHNPDEIAKLAREAFNEMMQELEASG